MKKIKPFKFWNNGKKSTAYYLYVNCCGDNLNDTAVFYWCFYDNDVIDDKPINKIIDGNITMTGEAYDNWDSNEYVYNWIAEQLGVIFL